MLLISTPVIVVLATPGIRRLTPSAEERVAFAREWLNSCCAQTERLAGLAWHAGSPVGRRCMQIGVIAGTAITALAPAFVLGRPPSAYRELAIAAGETTAVVTVIVVFSALFADGTHRWSRWVPVGIAWVFNGGLAVLALVVWVLAITEAGEAPSDGVPAFAAAMSMASIVNVCWIHGVPWRGGRRSPIAQIRLPGSIRRLERAIVRAKGLLPLPSSDSAFGPMRPSRAN